jgi:TolB-like protein
VKYRTEVAASAAICCFAGGKMTVMDANANQSQAPISSNEVVQILERILRSKTFLRSRRLSQFLRFAVEQDLGGRRDQLKEYTIGTNVYGRPPDFDPSQDSIVRAEARRLRMKLKEYRESEGQNDDVTIIFHPGGYLPTYRRAADSGPSSPINSKHVDGAKENFDPSLVVLAGFDSPAADPFANSLAFSLTDEVLHRLTQVVGIRVLYLAAGRTEVSKYGSQTILSGVVRTEGDLLFVTAREITAFGLVVWSERFEWTAQDSKAAIVSVATNAVLHRLSQRLVDQNNWSHLVRVIPNPIHQYDHISNSLTSLGFPRDQHCEHAELVT